MTGDTTTRQVLGDVRLSRRMAAPRLARWMVRNRCASSALPHDVIDAASLLAGEMVATALRLRHGEVRLVVSVEDAGLRVRVRSDGRELAGAGRRHAASSARCMTLVAHTSRAWGLDCTGSSYDFWALVAVT